MDKMYPNLKGFLKELIDENVLNLKPHDEGNYDVDRLDYILRDYLYNGMIIDDYSHEKYKRKFARLDENGNIMKSEDGSICLLDEQEENADIPKRRIDVYEESSLKPIENFLETRVQSYKNIYFHSSVQVLDSIVGLFVNNALNEKDGTAKEFKEFIKQIKEKDTKVDLDEYIKWDDINFYANCIDIAENSKNKNLRDFAGLIIPNLPALMNLTFSHLDLKKARENNYKSISETDRNFVQKIKELIYSDSDLSKMLKDKNYYNNNIFICCDDDKKKKIKEELGDRVSYSNATVWGYKDTTPIYIKDKEGRVFALHEHPERKWDWTKRKEEIEVAFAVVPLLRMQGYTEEQIETIKSYFDKEHPTRQKPKDLLRKVNMSPLKVGSKMEEYFEI